MSEARFSLVGKVIIVTGASRGIGRELAMLLAQTGAVVVPTCRTTQDIEGLVAEAAERGFSVHPTLLDVRDVVSIAAAVDQVVASHGRVDVLVNNAGLGLGQPAMEVSEADWDDMMAVNVRGMFFTSQSVARVMATHGGGRIINISSQGGLVGLPNAAVYCTSKGAVNMMTKALAVEWAELSINVNAVAPTFIHTPGTAAILDDPQTREGVLAKIPLGVLGVAEDVAGGVIYLASAASRLVTGTVLVIDGGWTAQ